MKRTRKLPVHRLRRRPPFFHPVPLRSRRDGWTVVRQCHFLAQLYLTGSVGAAARRVGMSRASAYRLRAREGAEGFAAAWDHVLTPPGAGRRARQEPDFRKVTLEALLRRAEAGLVQPVLYRGAFRSIREKPDNSALFRLLGRADALAARGEQAGEGGAAGISETGVVGVTPAGGGKRAGATSRHSHQQPTPPSSHGNGTTRLAGLTARAECGPSRQTVSRGNA